MSQFLKNEMIETEFTFLSINDCKLGSLDKLNYDSTQRAPTKTDISALHILVTNICQLVDRVEEEQLQNYPGVLQGISKTVIRMLASVALINEIDKSDFIYPRLKLSLQRDIPKMNGHLYNNRNYIQQDSYNQFVDLVGRFGGYVSNIINY